MPQIHRYSVKSLFLTGLFCAVFAITAITITAFSSLYWITSSANTLVEQSIQQTSRLVELSAALPDVSSEFQTHQKKMQKSIDVASEKLMHDKFDVLMLLSVVAIISLMLMAAGIGILSKVIFPSISQFLNAVEEYNAGELSYRLAHEQMPKELQNVATGFNTMAHQLEQSYAKLAYHATNDELTGVYNRRKFIMDLEREVKRAKRYSRGVSLMLIDMDDFSSVNDKHGHESGDKVLCKTVDFIYKSIRDSDSLYRYGSEEFAVILVEISDQDTGIVGERIRESICEYPIALPGGINVETSVSIGIANFPSHSDNEINLIHAADEALYRAKSQGKNQVVHTNEMVRAKAG
ncbi:MAG: GGDEF domain-containing protein [Gammaproteobacteria bacterium]|nr:GGDEF domain-containing protein [Gammaproteobacteria bacterium]MDH5799923.1 GGDEF domain-containing protein [Gammaproteobacteria bacterium]